MESRNACAPGDSRYRLARWIAASAFGGLALVLMMVQVPIIPMAPFLLYDVSDVAALIMGFAAGPVFGIVVVLIKNILFLMLRPIPTELIGVPMNIIAGVTFVGVASCVYWANRTRGQAIKALVCGSLAMVILMIPINYYVYPYLVLVFKADGAPAAGTYVVAMVTPFNIAKCFLSSLITLYTYKRMSGFIKRLHYFGR